jgi:hypothetical protein
MKLKEIIRILEILRDSHNFHGGSGILMRKQVCGYKYMKICVFPDSCSVMCNLMLCNVILRKCHLIVGGGL